MDPLKLSLVAHSTHHFASPVSPEMLDRVLALSGIERGWRVVDLGCRALLRIAGPLDVATTPALGEALQPFRGPGQQLILDLRRVEYIETPGLRLLLELNELLQSSGGRLCLVVQPGSRVDRTLRLIDFDRPGPLLASVREAWSGPAGPGGSAPRDRRQAA